MFKLISGLLMAFVLAVSSVGDSRVLRVAQDGSGDFIDVFRAVQAAQSGDTVQVAEGHYDAHGIRLEKPLVLLGAGADKTTLISNIGNLLTVKSEGCVIEGFELYADDAAFGSLPGEVVIVRCVASSPTIRQNTFRWSGVRVYSVWCEGRASPVIEHNNFWGR